MYLVQEEEGTAILLFRAISYLETLEGFSLGPSPNKDVRWLRACLIAFLIYDSVWTSPGHRKEGSDSRRHLERNLEEGIDPGRFAVDPAGLKIKGDLLLEETASKRHKSL